MRYTWQQIKQMYPDQWIHMKDMEFIKGDLKSAEIICTGKERQDIFDFEDENPDVFKNLTLVCTRYTGEIIEGLEYGDDDFYAEELNDVV